MAVREHLRELVRGSLRERDRMLLSKLSVAVGLRPRVNRAAAHKLAFPDGRKAAIVISADLELAWAWRFARSASDPLAFARRRARQGRQNLGPILALCERFDIPITWATVGHLFLAVCKRNNGLLHPEVPRVPYFENDLWRYQSGDWFDQDPGLADADNPEWGNWHGPDLIRRILQSPVAHEIGCHTFSHAVFSNQHCPLPVAVAELTSCQEAAAQMGVELRSFVFSGNLEGNHEALRQTDFNIYRADDWHDLDLPRRDRFGLWRLNGGVCLDRPYANSPSSDHVRLIRRTVDVAIERGMVCGLWFHPETDPRDVAEIFPPVFEHIARRRSELWVTTMGGLATWLDTQETAPPPAVASPPRSRGPASAAPTAYVCSMFDTGLAAARSLGRNGIPVVGLDSDPYQPGFRSRFVRARKCPDPMREPDRLLEYMVATGRQQDQPGVLLPASDAWVLFISRHRAELEPYFRFALPAPEVLEATVDKRRQYELAQKIGIPIPRTYYPTNIEQARQVAAEAEYPIFLKPYLGHLWREHFGGTHKGYKVQTPDELVCRFEEAQISGYSLMVQSLVRGPNTNHYKVCAYLSEAGETLALFTLRKLRQYPTEFGVGTLVESVRDDQLASLGLTFMRGIDYRGIGSVEFKRDERDGELKLIELNPRLWQQNSLAADCGVDFATIAYRDLIGDRQQPVLTFKTGVKWLDAVPDTQAALTYFRRGQLSLSAWMRSLYGVSSFATFAPDDILPFFSSYEFGLKLLRTPKYLLKKNG